MTTWTEQNTIETGWNDRESINSSVSILYNSSIPYDADYITYNGFYVEANIDWDSQNSIVTNWSE